MSNYELIANKYNWRSLRAKDSTCTEEFLQDYTSLYMTTERITDSQGKGHRYYRLHANKPHSIEMALAYDIHCPKCGEVLKQVGRCKDFHTLGLYRCFTCDKE